jgi:hypothetical protein
MDVFLTVDRPVRPPFIVSVSDPYSYVSAASADRGGLRRARIPAEAKYIDDKIDGTRTDHVLVDCVP